MKDRDHDSITFDFCFVIRRETHVLRDTTSSSHLPFIIYYQVRISKTNSEDVWAIMAPTFINITLFKIDKSQLEGQVLPAV